MWKLLPWAATDKMDSRKARVILPRNVTNRKKAIQKIKDPRERHIAELKQIAQEAANTKAAYEKRQREKDCRTGGSVLHTFTIRAVPLQ